MRSEFILAVVLATIAPAIGKADSLGDCRRIAAAADRLKCYDALPGEVASPARVGGASEWKGVGMMTTRPFHMDGPWELQWDAKGFLQAMMYVPGQGKDTAMPEILANQSGAGQGSAYVDRGGDFYITFSGLAPWSARAVPYRP